MSEYIPQTSSSDRYAAARRTVENLRNEDYDLSDWDARKDVIRAIEALITPPGVHESDTMLFIPDQHIEKEEI